MNHWEGRALKAESMLHAQAEEVARLIDTLTTWRVEADARTEKAEAEVERLTQRLHAVEADRDHHKHLAQETARIANEHKEPLPLTSELDLLHSALRHVVASESQAAFRALNAVRRGIEERDARLRAAALPAAPSESK